VRRSLERPGGRTVDELVEADRDFAGAFAAYQREYGCRCLRYEVADPTVAETPALVLQLIRDQLARDFDPAARAAALAQQRAAAVAAARVALAGRSAEDRQRFERALARAERAYPVREDNEFYTDTGGILSHPAIISREYGVPAVVATGNATRLLRDGQLVGVDGTAGTVGLAP
jgi:rifampicin phosphotransferase